MKWVRNRLTRQADFHHVTYPKRGSKFGGRFRLRRDFQPKKRDYAFRTIARGLSPPKRSFPSSLVGPTHISPHSPSWDITYRSYSGRSCRPSFFGRNSSFFGRNSFLFGRRTLLLRSANPSSSVGEPFLFDRRTLLLQSANPPSSVGEPSLFGRRTLPLRSANSPSLVGEPFLFGRRTLLLRSGSIPHLPSSRIR